MIISNEDVKEVISEIPEGHKHIRTTVTFLDGREITLHEATIANIVRAYIAVKTHPTRTRIVLKGTVLEKIKEGYARWQLVED